MCLIHCAFCRDAGSLATWGGAVPCICVQPCPHCGSQTTTAAHRQSCASGQRVRTLMEAGRQPVSLVPPYNPDRNLIEYLP